MAAVLMDMSIWNWSVLSDHSSNLREQFTHKCNKNENLSDWGFMVIRVILKAKSPENHIKTISFRVKQTLISLRLCNTYIHHELGQRKTRTNKHNTKKLLQIQRNQKNNQSSKNRKILWIAKPKIIWGHCMNQTNERK